MISSEEKQKKTDGNRTQLTRELSPVRVAGKSLSDLLRWSHDRREDYIMEMGKEIRRLRNDRGITQEALAAALNVTAQTISKWECGTSPDLCMRILRHPGRS